MHVGSFIALLFIVCSTSVLGAPRLAAGENHSLRIADDTTVWSFGENLYGQLGDGTFISRSAPVQVQALSQITSISGGEFHSLALRQDGTV